VVSRRATVKTRTRRLGSLIDAAKNSDWRRLLYAEVAGTTKSLVVNLDRGKQKPT
jgi:hypothetical protein